MVMGAVRDHAAATHRDLLVGVDLSDDAGVYDLGDGRALVQTVDFFTPVVDDPGDWGRIAAANALSDVYAMGGVPKTALQYLAWPRDKLDFGLAGEVVSGGLELMQRAGCTVVGGHSIDSPEPTYGFAVTGLVGTDAYFPNSWAQSGDVLVLTKPLGIGIITTAIKRGACPPEVGRRAIETMTALNDVAGRSLAPAHAHSATDVTGFGLLGHLREMCIASGVGAIVSFAEVPLLAGARELLEAGMTEKELAGALKMPPWRAKKVVALARRADREALQRAICRFADLEVDLRGGGTLDEETAVTLALAR